MCNYFFDWMHASSRKIHIDRSKRLALYDFLDFVWKKMCEKNPPIISQQFWKKSIQKKLRTLWKTIETFEAGLPDVSKDKIMTVS